MQLIVAIIIFITCLAEITYAMPPKESFVLKCEYGTSIKNILPDSSSMPTNSESVNIYGNYGKYLPYDLFLSKCKRGDDIGKSQDIELWGVTNNLIHNANNPENVDMQVLIIQGRLLDANCVPISDATIRIMQPSLMESRVDYRKLTEDENKNLRLARESIGTATAITNNLGLFTLITRRPNVGKLPSNISLYILHSDFSNHYEVISSKKVYTLDALYPELNITQYIPLYRQDIILNQLNKYRTF
ncbi:hypothetical protein NOVO_05230 [Rickettsiales bacterium Ac37b]|nr:hypothetical protein NOVO_05230 [Rickettsiales bacterium Ac37b]